MTISHVGTGAVAQGTTSASPALPGGYTVVPGDLAIVNVVTRESAEATPTCTWQNVGSASGGGGAFGNGTGPARCTFFLHELVPGDVVPTVSVAGTSPCIVACVTILSRTAGNCWGWAAVFGADTDATTTAFSATMSGVAAIGIKSGDHISLLYGIRDDCTGSAQGVTATSATFGTVTERADGLTTNANDAAIQVATCSVTAGAATAAPVVTQTLSTAESGEAGFLVIRESNRLFFGPTTVPNITPTPDGSWDTSEFVRRCLIQNKVAGTEILAGTLGGAAGNNRLVGQFISPPLDGAQTISGNWNCCTSAREVDVADNINRRPRKALVVSDDGTTVRGTLFAFAVPGATTELSTTLSAQVHASDNTMTTVNAQDGDRVVVELGYQEDAIGTDPQWEFRCGGNGDLVTPNNNDAGGTVGWVEFPSALVFKREADLNRSMVTLQAVNRGANF